jgi:predicted phage terminase large subunit-like protein
MTDRRVFNAVLATDLTAFLERSYRDLDTRNTLSIAPYVEYLLAELMEVVHGTERRLIINLPSRHLKSILTSIVLPAWLLGRDPALRIGVVSHSQSLARDLALRTLRVLASDWYAEAFPQTVLRTDRAGAMDFETTAGGGRYAASLDSGVTGRGFNLIVLDDPLSAHDMRSSAERERVKDAFDGMIATRLDNPAKGAIIVVHQRLHVDDLSGHLIRKGGWKHISLPLTAQETTTYRIGAHTWERRIGDILLPETYTDAVIQDLQKNRAAFFAAQYQQNPTAAQGEYINPESIDRFESLPSQARRITFSIDTAVKCTEGASFTVALVVASDGQRHYVVDVLRRRLDIVQVLDAVLSMVQRYGPTTILIEDASSGPGLARMLRERGQRAELWPTGGRSKEERLEEHLHMFVQGRVLVKANQPWTSSLINEWATFPNDSYDDQVDAITQYLDWFARRTIPNAIVKGAYSAEDRFATRIFGPPPRKGEHPMRPRHPRLSFWRH